MQRDHIEKALLFGYRKREKGTISARRMRISKVGARRPDGCLSMSRRKIEKMSPYCGKKHTWRRGHGSCPVTGQCTPGHLQGCSVAAVAVPFEA